MAAAAGAVSARLRRSTRIHDDYEVRVAGRTVLATVTVARRWIYTTLWRGSHRLHSGKGLIVGLGVQWTPPFLDSSSDDESESEPRPGTLQLCSGQRSLVFQIAQANKSADDGAIPAVLRRFLDDPRVAFVCYSIGSDCRKLSAHQGLEVRCARELRAVTGMGNTSMERMAERLLGWSGVKKPRQVAVRCWNGRELSEEQVTYACLDAYIS